MPDRRRQRQQRVRQDPGGDARSVGASNREPVKEETLQNNVSKPQKQSSGVAFAEPKEYESVTIMPDKEAAEPQKYQRREILSNWLRYEDLPPEEPEDGEDYLIGEDFATILEQQVNTGKHLMLKGETLWDDTETNILKSHGLGALHVADLVAAINTIPLQVQLNIPEDSLPESVTKYYTSLAEDNRKVYQPNKGYNDCLDVNEKILQALKLNDNEPLNLVSDTSENQETLKNAVDVALSLSEAFAPEPDDVDLDLLVEEPSQEKPADNDVEPDDYIMENSPIKKPNPKEPSPVKERSPVKEPSPLKKPSPVKEQSPVEISNLQKQATVTQQPSSLSEKQPAPTDTNNQKENIKEKTHAAFNFGLPMSSTSNLPLNFGLPKTEISSIQTNAIVANALKDVDLGLPSKEEEKALDGPTIDLDAPVTQDKPVLLLTKTEEDDLEDWLDSVLDD